MTDALIVTVVVALILVSCWVSVHQTDKGRALMEERRVRAHSRLMDEIRGHDE